MAFNFPLNPAANTIYNAPNNCTYTYSHGRWVGNFALQAGGGGGTPSTVNGALPVGFVGYSCNSNSINI